MNCTKIIYKEENGKATINEVDNYIDTQGTRNTITTIKNIDELKDLLNSKKYYSNEKE